MDQENAPSLQPTGWTRPGRSNRDKDSIRRTRVCTMNFLAAGTRSPEQKAGYEYMRALGACGIEDEFLEG